MRKAFVVLCAVLLAAAMVAPAMADTKISGFYRAKMYVSNFKHFGAATTDVDCSTATTTTSVNTCDDTFTYVEQRARMKFEFGDENAKMVYYPELDPTFGIGNFEVNRNQGGALGADSVQLETKNLYAWFKIPDTTWQFTVGLANVSDSYAGVIFGYADMSGVFATFKYEPVDVRLGWSNWLEGAASQSDDTDFYMAEVKFVPGADMKLGVNLYFLRDGGAADLSTPVVAAARARNKTYVYTPGVDFTWKVGPGSLNAFFLYQFGTLNDGLPTEGDIKGFALDARYDMNLGPGKLFVEGLYVTGDDNPTDPDYDSIITAGNIVGSQDYFSRTDMQILFSNLDDLSTNQPLNTNVNGGGRGMLHLAAGYSQKFGDKLSGKVGLGWAQFAEKTPTSPDKGIGTEINANVNYDIMKGLNFGFYAAYCLLGDHYDNPGFDPDDPYDLHFRLQYAF